MTVLRVVTNIAADNPELGVKFYQDLLGLEPIMNLGWIITLSSGETMPTQLSIASEGGSGTPVPDLSIEVDNVDDVYQRAKNAGLDIVYGLADEPWGARRFYVRDPFGKIVNVLQHTTS